MPVYTGMRPGQQTNGSHLAEGQTDWMLACQRELGASP